MRRVVGPGHGAQVAPAVGVENGSVEVVVEFLQDTGQPLLMGEFFFGVEGFAAAQFFQHVVHIGQGESWVCGWVGGLLAFAVRVDLLRKITDSRLLPLTRIRKRKRFK
jgi:hypothetical protein